MKNFRIFVVPRKKDLKRGLQQGAFEKQKEMYIMMHSNGASLEQIARLCSVSVSDIESILK